MAERTYVVQKTQIGVEATPGTSVAATKRMQTVSIDTEPQVTVQDFRPLGSKYMALAVEQREWVQAPIKGYPSYGDLVYLLSSIINTPVISQVLDGSFATAAYKWVFDSSNVAEDNPKTFTVEQGSPVRAQRYSYGILRELSLKFSRQTVDLTGMLLAQRLQDNVALTGGVVDIPLVPLMASGFDVYIDPTFAALGTTKLGRLFDGHFVLNNRFGPIWTVDSSQASWAAHVELPPTVTFVMIVEADANGMAYLNTLRNGQTVFCRIRNLSQTLTGANTGGPVAASPRVDPAGSVVAGTLGTLVDAALVATDVGRAVTGPANLAPNTTLTAVTPGTSGTISPPATAAFPAQAVNIGTAIPYSSTLDLALKVNHLGKFSDVEGVYAVEFGFIDVNDTGWGKALHWEVVNTLATL